MNKISLFALHTTEFYRNIGNLQSMKGRMVVKWNWWKSRIIFPRENEHLVLPLVLFPNFTGVSKVGSSVLSLQPTEGVSIFLLNAELIDPPMRIIFEPSQPTAAN